MRVVMQRVTSASVTVEKRTVGEIKKGLLLLVGITGDDTKKDAELIVRKCLNTRLWPDKENPDRGWASSVVDNDYELLVVSQFTLYGKLKKGNKPDFHMAMPPDQATVEFDHLLEMFRKSYKAERIQQGEFGAMMKVALENDGPVTIYLDSADWQDPGSQSQGANGIPKGQKSAEEKGEAILKAGGEKGKGRKEKTESTASRSVEGKSTEGTQKLEEVEDGGLTKEVTDS
uniref:D-aminoacyl-tRNA deacylase n=1 Tax=Chromera velia CCMP2878 TaxID=1169474 RepID=A0A0G4GXJ7_9ALVE|eukprot:Cvel_792.t1-p1 / transcript=Cvel_792.t1 / gene=Cvel_792 / organism=Chromera_velia_CCMP2878 / gene_product=D-tyrosyl-tRNA(Tyr) deacylase, putative / transcript_product=D-tyrosyl-tRNA(Tyr) deacylase, putative / location=Cvel_scaffold24:159585-163284(-) / protein_length=229 / sequence_SO=supercontig / SO=protein_coding / is_pseudo=false